MAYTHINKLRTHKGIIDVYNKVKHHDVPDTWIVKNYFPKHGIYISYRNWMRIKALNEKDVKAE